MSLSSGLANGQTDFSPRMRGLSTYLGGIVEDTITDAFLNPARVAAVSGSQLYIANHPSKSVIIPYPGPHVDAYDRSPYPLEFFWTGTSPRYAHWKPYEATLFRSIGTRSVLSFSVVVSADEWESLDESGSTTVGDTSPVVDVKESASASRSQRTRLLVSGTLSRAPTEDGSGAGLRVTLSRTTSEKGWVSTSQNTHFHADVSEAMATYSFDRDQGDFGEIDARIAGGIHRPGRGVRDVVLEAGYSQRELPAEAFFTTTSDDDEDRNGIDPDGGTPDYSLARTRHSTDRTYDGPVVRARVHADVGERVTAVGTASWIYRSGDGFSDYDARILEIGGLASDELSDRVVYTYDGRDREYVVSAALGYRDDLTTDLEFSFGAFGSFMRWNFSENGTGLATLSSSTLADTIAFTTAYGQRVQRLQDQYLFVLPAALEWSPLSYLAFRLGLELHASRAETETVVRRRLDTTRSPVDIAVRSGDRSRDIEHRVSFRAQNGMGVRLADRLFVDLYYATGSVAIDLARYANLSIRYRF